MSALRYTVRRNNWQPGMAGEWVRLPGDDFVAGFGNPTLADRVRDRLEQVARTALTNPFRQVPDLAALTSLPAFALADWLQDDGLAPPSARADGSRNWAAWWDDRRKFWPPAHVARLFAGLDRLRFYTLTERPPEQTAFVAVEPLWGYAIPPAWRDLNPLAEQPVPYGQTPDGGRPVRAFRSADDAVAFVELASEPGQRQWIGPAITTVPRRWLERPHSEADWHALRRVRWDRVPACRVHEIEWADDGPPAGTAYLVCRFGWRPGHDPRIWADLDYRQERRMVPVVACASAETAIRRTAELDAAAFAEWTPYHFEGAATDMERIASNLGFVGLREEATDFDGHPRRLSRAEEVRKWWDVSARHWSAERRAEVWPWVGPRLHQVLAVPFEG